ncbi:MAG: hypothetical protein ACLTW9_09935 [Enterocloster sp.]
MDEHVHYGSFGGRLFSNSRKRQQQAAPPPLWTLHPRKRTCLLRTPCGGEAAKAEHTSSADFAFPCCHHGPKESVFEEVRHLPEVGVATLKLLWHARAPHFTVMMKPY